MIIKSSQFLRNGAMALLAAGAFIGMTANPSHDISNSASLQIPSQMVAHLADGVDYLSYKTIGHSVTQDTEAYRYNVMKNFLFKNLEKEINEYGRFSPYDSSAYDHVQENLNVAKDIGVFKNSDVFEGEMKILKENASVKDPFSLENVIKFVKDGEPFTTRDSLTSDLIEKNHYEGVQNIEEAKQNVIKNIEKIREARATNSNSMENTLKNRM